MSDALKKIRDAGIAVAIAGGSLFAGNQVGKPACDYVFVDAQQKETCLTSEQAQIFLDNLKGSNTGFGSSQFESIKLIKK